MKDNDLVVGMRADRDFYETHILRFEKYVVLPLELRLMKEKMQIKALEEYAHASKMKYEEVINPWLIVDFDEALQGNHNRN